MSVNYTFNLKVVNGEIIGTSQNYTGSTERENCIAEEKKEGLGHLLRI